MRPSSNLHSPAHSSPHQPTLRPAARLLVGMCVALAVPACTADAPEAACVEDDDCAADQRCDASTSRCTTAPAEVCVPDTTGCIPDPPAAGGGVADGYSVTFALRDLDFQQYDPARDLHDPAQPWSSIGFDLDGMATSSTASASTCLPPSDDSPSVRIDGLAGIDNVLGGTVWPAMFHVAYEPDLCCVQSRGVGTLLLRVSGWNGRRDDAVVEASILVASAGTSTPVAQVAWSPTLRGPALAGQAGTAAAFPSWAPGADTYFVGADQVVAADLGQPVHRDLAAYVVGGTLVMAIDEGSPLRMYFSPGNSHPLTITAGHLVARMSPFTEAAADGSGFVPPAQLDEGTLAGRMRASDFDAAVLGYFGEGLESDGDCDQALATAHLVAQQASDVLADPSREGLTPTPVCDAMSLGIAFHGVRAAGEALAGDQGTLHHYEPSCDVNAPAPRGPEIPFLAGACVYNSAVGCDLPAFVPTP